MIAVAPISLHTSPREIYNIGDKVKTPANLHEFDSNLTQSIDSYLLEFASSYGYPVGYVQEQHGSLVQNLFPIKGNETEQISSSSKVQLELHTETAFHPWKPDVLILFCLKGDRRAETTLSILSDILPKLSNDTINILKQERFLTSIDASFRNAKQPNRQIQMSILSDDCLSMTFDQYLMKGIDVESREALEQFRQAVISRMMGLALTQGDILVIDNHKVIHGRTAFTPRHDGTDRWLKRVMVRRELPPLDQMSGSVITTIL